MLTVNFDIIFFSFFKTLSCFLPYSTGAMSIRISGGMFSEKALAFLRIPAILLLHVRYNVVNPIIPYRLFATSMCWNLTPNVMVWGGGAFWRWWSHEVEPSLVGLVPLQKRPREFPHSSCHVKTQWKYGHLWTRKQLLGRHRICWTLSLRNFVNKMSFV